MTIQSENLLVKINSCSVSEITPLSGIGPKLAERIINYRDSKGYFKGPEDLSKVKGVSMRLAATLSPYIDWQIPDDLRSQSSEDLNSKLPKFPLLLFFLTGILNAFYLLQFDTLLSINQLQAEFQSTGSLPLNRVLTTISGTIMYSVTLISLIVVFVYTIIGRRFGKRHFGLLGICVLLHVLALLLSGIGNTVYYLLSSPDGINRLLADIITVTELGYSIASIFIFIPLAITFWKPHMIASIWLARLFDASFIVFGLTFGVYGWLLKNETYWFMLLFPAILGIIFILLGVKSLLTGRSLFQVTVDFIFRAGILDRRFVQQNEAIYWYTWLNTLLPNPEDQKALQQALSKLYKPSPIETLVKLVVVVIGGWLLTTVLGAIVEWVVQGWLEKIFSLSG